MMNCIAVDDESLALDLLEDNIRRVPFLNLVKRCKGAFDAYEILRSEKNIDLMFLDIQMPGVSGIQFLQSIPAAPLAILTTAYSSYALESYSFNVVDYLLKPIEFDRFLKATNKAYELFRLRASAVEKKAVVRQEPEFIFVNADYHLVKVMIADIVYIEGLKDYIKIHVNNNTRPIITRLTLKSMEETLPPTSFVRVHKSYIVNVKRINTIRRGRIAIGTIHIPISNSHRDFLFKIIDPNSFLSSEQ